MTQNTLTSLKVTKPNDFDHRVLPEGQTDVTSTSFGTTVHVQIICQLTCANTKYEQFQ